MGQIAFAAAGNLYFADGGNERVRRIDRGSGIIRTIAGNGTAGYAGDGGAATAASLSNPTGVAVDSQGQVYILSNAPTAGSTQVLRKAGITGYVSFGGLAPGTASTPHTVTVTNTGNEELTLSYSALINGTDPTDFAIDPGTTNCALTAGATLDTGNSCTIGVIFHPGATGRRTANLVLQDDTAAGTNVVQLVGTGALPATKMTIASPAAGSSVSAGTPLTFAVSVSATGVSIPMGTVIFKDNGTAIGNPITLPGSGKASTMVTESTAGTYTLSATYSGDANYASATVSESLQVTG